MPAHNIKRLTIYNFKNIESKNIEPRGKSFELSGKNGAGKSAIIEAIHWALRGNKTGYVNVIRDDEKETLVFLDTGELLVTRTQERDKPPVLTVQDNEGKIYKSPQTMLNDLVAPVTFDPTQFMNAKDKDQLDMLKRLVDPEGKIEAVEIQYAEVYDKRTAVGRKEKEFKAVSGDLPYHNDVEGMELQDHAALLREYEESNNRYIAREEALREAERLEQEYLEAEKKLKAAQEKLQLYPIISPDSLADRKSALENAEAVNEKIRANQKKDEASQNHLAAMDEYLALGDKCDTLKAKITKMITDSDMPVEGMSFGDDCILLNDRPLKSCSTGEQLEASLKVSTALNKGLRVIMIEDWTLLDNERHAQVMEFAKANGVQLIVEQVTDGTEVAIIFEENNHNDKETDS